MPPDADGAFGVLFVCTGNICRSPTAEALARRELARYPGAPIQLSSAGQPRPEGNPAASRSLAASSRGPAWSGTSPASDPAAGPGGRPDPVHGRRAPTLRAQLRPGRGQPDLPAGQLRRGSQSNWLATSRPTWSPWPPSIASRSSPATTSTTPWAGLRGLRGLRRAPRQSRHPRDRRARQGHCRSASGPDVVG